MWKLLSVTTPGRKADGNGRSAGAGVAVLGKAMGLIDRLADAGELTPAQLAEQTGEPRSTVYRLLGSLQELGLVEPGPRRGTYVLGLKVFQLGSTVVSRFDVRQAALPMMERLHEQFGETTFLCVRRDLDAVCIERIDGERVNLLALRLGGTLPLHLGGAPRALMAFEPPSFWERYLRERTLEALTDKTPATPEAVTAELRATRERGYAISDEDVTPGVASLGAPVFDHSGAVRASISLGGLRDQLLEDCDDAVASLLEAAASVSRMLGHAAGAPADASE